MKHILIGVSLFFGFGFLFQVKPILAQTKPAPIELKAEQYAKLNAMLVIGSSVSIDSSIVELGKYLRGLGVNVYEFHHPNAIWDDMISISNPIHIFVYRGHGTLLGENKYPGGLVITKPKFISSDDIKNDLPLAKNSLILFQSVCYATGSSAGDDSNVSLTNAIHRVENYAKPFIEKGAGAYYAINISNGLKSLLLDFFRCDPAIDIYKMAYNRWCDINTIQQYSFNNSYLVSVSSHMPKEPTTIITTVNGKSTTKKSGPFLSYDKAFVGKPTFNVLDFFE